MCLTNILQVIGGIALLLFGLSLISDSVRRYAGPYLKAFLGAVTRRRWRAVAVGTILAAILQSSSAATVLLVEMSASGLLNVPQALAVALGTGIGSSLTVQIIAFRIAHYALALFALGALLHFLRNEESKASGAVLMGFGLMFLGMEVMREGFEPLKNSPSFVAALSQFGETPWLAVLVAAALTAVIQASAATVALAMTLSAAGLLPLPGAVAIVLGANVGTAATAFIPTFRRGRVALHVALGNLTLRIAACLAFMAIFPLLADLVSRMGASVERQLANFNLLFNLVAAALLAPLTVVLARGVEYLIPRRAAVRQRPALAIDISATLPVSESLARAREDVVRAAERTAQFVERAAELIETPSRRLLRRMAIIDDEIDALVEILIIYLARVGRQPMSPEEQRQRRALLGVLRILERIGDLISKEVLPQVEQRISRGLFFSVEGARHLRAYHAHVGTQMKIAVESIRAGHAAKRTVSKPERQLADVYEAYYAQVRDGVKAAVDTTTQFIDTMAVLEQIESMAGELQRMAGDELGPPLPQGEG